MKWDFDYETEDDFAVVLDTYGDKRNAYRFVINPNGAQYDDLVMDNGRKSNSTGTASGMSRPADG